MSQIVQDLFSASSCQPNINSSVAIVVFAVWVTILTSLIVLITIWKKYRTEKAELEANFEALVKGSQLLASLQKR